MGEFSRPTRDRTDNEFDVEGSFNSPQLTDQTSTPAAGMMARAMSWLSFALGGALVGCLVAFTVPYYSAWKSQKPTHPINWILRFGGAKPDQTFEKYLRDSGEKSRREWEETYRNSPAFQIDPEHPRWNIDSAPLLQQQPRRSQR